MSSFSCSPPVHWVHCLSCTPAALEGYDKDQIFDQQELHFEMGEVQSLDLPTGLEKAIQHMESGEHSMCTSSPGQEWAWQSMSVNRGQRSKCPGRVQWLALCIFSSARVLYPHSLLRAHCASGHSKHRPSWSLRCVRSVVTTVHISLDQA